MVEEVTEPRLRSGTIYGLCRLTNPVNSYRNRFEHEFSGANVGLRSGITCTNVKLRKEHKIHWHNAKKKGKAYKGDDWLKNQLTQVVGRIFSQIAKHDMST